MKIGVLQKKLPFQWNKKRLLRLGWSVVRLVLILGLSFIILYPVLIKLSTSFKSMEDLYDPNVVFIPRHPTLDNFKLVWQSVNYPVALLKSLGITLVISLLQLTSCTLVAYGIARFRFKGRGILMAMIILTLVIPPQTILLPLYLRFRFFNIFQIFQFGGTLSGVSLLDTIIPFLCLSATGVAFKNGLYIFMMRQYFINMPKVLEEAAYIDGCSKFRTFYRIMLPGAVPMMVTIFLFAFVWQWNDYYYSSVLAPELPTLSNVMLSINFAVLGEQGSDFYNSILNAPKFILVMLPLIILYIFTQRYFTESISRSGIVG